MSYLTKDNFAIRIKRVTLDDLLMQAIKDTDYDGDTFLLEQYRVAESEIKSFLSDVYEIETELARDSTDATDVRNRLIMKCYVDIVLYHLHSTIAPSDVPTIREELYNECRELLDAMRSEMINPDLPKKTDRPGNTKIMSNTKFIYHPHDDMAQGQTQTEAVDPNP